MPNGSGGQPEGDSGSAALTDGELIRYLDDELSGDAKERLEARLAVQPEARERLSSLRRRSAGLSALVGELNPTERRVRRSAQAIRPRMAPGSARRRGWLALSPAGMRAAAAIFLLLVAGIAAVPPARAWVLDRVRDAAAALGLVETVPGRETPSQPAPAAPAGAPVIAGFAVAADTFEVQVLQATGVLIVRQRAGQSASFAAENAPGAEPVIGSRGLRLEGPPAADAIFELDLPAAVPAIRVRRNGDETVTYLLPAAGQELRIELPGR